MSRLRNILVILCALSTAHLCAEERSMGVGTSDVSVPAGMDASAIEIARQRLLDKLKKKLTNHKGEPVSVVIFSPMDYSTTEVGPTVTKTLQETLKQYGDLQTRSEEYTLETLTLEEFRIAMARYRADVLIVSVIKNTNFDLYIYDRRTPYYIYAHSEAIPELTQLQISPEAAAYYGKLVMRRTLYRFINDQYFELPRQESAPVLQSEIPRWIASRSSLARVNNEILSNWRASVTTGAAISLGRRSEWWNSPVLGLSLSYKIYKNWFLQAALESSSYNALMGSVRYIFDNKSSPYKIGVSLGWAYLTNRFVWNVDETFGLGASSYYLVPGGELLFPIGDVNLVVQLRMFYGIDEKKYLWTVGPGVEIHF